MSDFDPRAALRAMFGAAVAQVHGGRAVAAALAAETPPTALSVIAIGKAAAAMTAGVAGVWPAVMARALVISRREYTDFAAIRALPVTFVEGAHPVPDARSLAAGAALLEFIAATPAHQPLLFLVSGGASSLVEVAPPGVSAAALARLNEWLLAGGLPIDKVNQIRRAVSQIKGGRLAATLGARPVLALYVSDVPTDDPAVIGSGLLAAVPETAIPDDLPAWVRVLIARSGRAACEPTAPPRVRHRIVARLSDAMEATAARARALGLSVEMHNDRLAGDAAETGRRLVRRLCAARPGVHIWGGETTVRLPPNPGRGGRNQHLALAAAIELVGRPDITLLAAGTDGCDGDSDAAGAVVDATTVVRGAAQGLAAAGCLAAADSGRFFVASGDALVVPPTGTNVADLVIALFNPA